MEAKWYSNELTAETTQKLQRQYGKIKRPLYGVNNRDQLALSFSLSLEGGYVTDCILTAPNDIRELLVRTKAYKVPHLEGKVVETYSEGNVLRGISVNDSLV